MDQKPLEIWFRCARYGSRRSPRRPKDQTHTPLGQTRHKAVCAKGSTHCLSVAVWSHLSRSRKSRRPCHASPNKNGANSHAMEEHLKIISANISPDAHGVLVLDQAGWHTAHALAIPDNITLLPLPPRSPELNPVENLWQFMRNNWLSNRIFKNYNDIVDHCCDAWRKIEAQPWRISSIGFRAWAHEF
jgi:transposase